MKREARYYKNEKGKIRCNLCPHNCLIDDGKRGACNVREASIDIEGNLKLYTLNYGEITSMAIDPVEKKPLHEFYPNSNILSVGSFGCNFKCSFCQNYSISQYEADSRFVDEEELAQLSLSLKDSIGLAFTYNEPSIWFEYVIDVAKRIKEQNKNHKVVLVTNGYINEEPLRKLLQYVDALNIDLKGNAEYYKKLCFGSLEDVKRTITIANDEKKHIEVTTLLVPNSNCDNKSIEEVGVFLSNLNKDIPLHVSRYFPRYKMTERATSLDEMKMAYNLLKNYLNKVYLGNLNSDELSYCLNKD